MPQVNYYPKSTTQTFGIATWRPEELEPNKKYMLWIVGHGAGETGSGSQAALQTVVNWGGWNNIELAVDKYKFLVVFVNTASRYDKGEYQYAKKWALENLPVDTNNIWLLGHSLGSYGAGNYAFTDPEFTKGVNGWLISSTGGFTERTILYDNLSTNKVKVWGVTAINDSVVPYTYVTRVKTALENRNPNHPVIMTVFPSTTWSDGTAAHNNTVGRLTALSTTQLVYSGTTGRLPTNSGGFDMNIYEWTLSNPKGSLYQPPTEVFVGPKYDDPMPIPNPTTTVNRTGVTITDDKDAQSFVVEIWWAGAPSEKYTAKAVYFSDKSDRFDITLKDGTVRQVFKTKKI